MISHSEESIMFKVITYVVTCGKPHPYRREVELWVLGGRVYCEKRGDGFKRTRYIDGPEAKRYDFTEVKGSPGNPTRKGDCKK